MPSPLITHHVVLRPVSGPATPRDSIGGPSVLPEGVDAPSCSCGCRMILFFKFDVASTFGLPFLSGSHFSIFMCPVHNEAVEQIGPYLPERFWDHMRSYSGVPRFFRAFLHAPGRAQRIQQIESPLVHHSLTFDRAQEVLVSGDAACSVPEHPGVSSSLEQISADQSFKVGGQPSWLQDAVRPVCCCGAPMTFLCQVPSDYEFFKTEGAPEQPNSPASDSYVLFLGNASYFFACTNQCSPLAVYPVLQN